MCLAIPGKVLEIDRTLVPLMGTVSFGGVHKQVCLEWMPEVAVGEYVIVHVGYALQKLDQEEAERTLQMFAEMGQLDELREEFGGMKA